MTVAIHVGDCRDVLRMLPAKSVQCVVTSPPYWGLRDYGLGPDALGLEPTPELYLQHLVEIFREVRRVLRHDGTVWLNLGDSYAANRTYQVTDNKHKPVGNNSGMSVPPGLKPKDLCGIPWRVAFALQADGWWLRSDIIWNKPNPMPESVTDRPTKAHEYLFLLTKSARYFYDAHAVREPQKPESKARYRYSFMDTAKHRTGGYSVDGALHTPGMKDYNVAGRNRRTVWTVPTSPFPEAHFATFPPALVEPCIKAGSSEKGCCPVCGAG